MILRSTAVRTLGAAVLLLSLAACNGGGTSTSLAANTASPAATTPAPTASPSPAATAAPTPTALAIPGFNAGRSNTIRLTVGGLKPSTVSAKITVTPLAKNGAGTVTTSACTPGACSIAVSGPVGFNEIGVTQLDAAQTVLGSGSLRVMVPAVFSPTVGVTFTGPAKSVALSMEPNTVIAGQPAALTFSLVAKDAQGNHIIGSEPFAVPITIASSDGGSAIRLTSNAFTSANATIQATYTGASSGALKIAFTSGTSALTRIRHAASTDGSTTLEVDAPPHNVMVNGKAEAAGGDIADDAEELISLADEQGQLPQAIVRGKQALAAVVDLSPNMPPAGDQGTQGSCGPFSSTYALLSYYAKQKFAWNYLLSSGGIDYTHILSPAFTYNSLNGGQDSGTSIVELATFATTAGAATWQTMPYNANDFTTAPSANAKSEAQAYAISDFREIPQGDVNAVRTLLAAGTPVLWRVAVDDSFSTLTPGQVWNAPYALPANGHAMALVGYDDNLQAFKLQNSWGTTWASNGTAYISYAAWQKNPTIQSLYLIPR
ncbi:MAG: hypothetical protein NVSMB64_32300 [Candidatus Velthaea sp.]